MLGYADFYDIAKYGNKNWKGNFSEKEIACYAFDYLIEFEASKLKGGYHVTSTIQELLSLLDEDKCDQCTEWANKIRRELSLCRTEK